MFPFATFASLRLQKTGKTISLFYDVLDKLYFEDS